MSYFYRSRDPVIISPSILFTQKDFSVDFLNHYRHVRIAVETRPVYLQHILEAIARSVLAELTVQVRRKWQNNQPDLKTGDVVSIHDLTVHRGHLVYLYLVFIIYMI